MTVKIPPKTFQLHEPVICNGKKGTVVDAYPEADRYTVELFDGNGDTADVMDCSGRQLERRSANGSS